MGLAYKKRNAKTALEITGIGKTSERVIELILKDGGRANVRRDLVEIYACRAFVPRWLFDRINKKSNKRR